MTVQGRDLHGNCSPDDWNGNTLLTKRMVDLFYSEDPDDIDMAKSICEGCPVRAECLTQGEFEEYGVWGGLSAEERRKR